MRAVLGYIGPSLSAELIVLAPYFHDQRFMLRLYRTLCDVIKTGHAFLDINTVPHQSFTSV